MHTLGGFNETSFLRCQRPIYGMKQPPPAVGSGEWLSEEPSFAFWDEMRELYKEAPGALPEPDPVDDFKLPKMVPKARYSEMHER